MQAKTTIFSQIINKELPADFLFEDDDLIVIKDKYPKAKTHLLIIPKKPIETVNHIDESEGDHLLIGKMFLRAKAIAKELNLEGYKLLFNVGEKGGQVIFHLHLHLMAD